MRANQPERVFLANRMSTHLSTLFLLSERKRAQTLLTPSSRECQLISPNAKSAHRAQADQPTLNQQVAGSSPARRTEIYPITLCPYGPCGTQLPLKDVQYTPADIFSFRHAITSPFSRSSGRTLRVRRPVRNDHPEFVRVRRVRLGKR